jgi:hypothetical protein
MDDDPANATPPPPLPTVPALVEPPLVVEFEPPLELRSTTTEPPQLSAKLPPMSTSARNSG